MSRRLWDWLGRVTCPGYRALFEGPLWKRSLASWWLAKWGWCFFYSKPWRPGSLDEDEGV